MGATGVPDDRNLVFTDSPVLKASPFIANDLTHFVDDKIDALTSIRAACWTQNRFAPTLHLVPTQWANGTSLN